MSFKEKFEIDSDITPICPYCEQEVDVNDFVEGGTSLIQKVSKIKVPFAKVTFMTNIFFCPHCRKLLGISKSYIG